MASVLVMKNGEGKLEGFGQRGAKSYARFLSDVRKLEVGEMLAFSYKAPRSEKFHRLHFLMLGAIYEAQDFFTNELHFRKWGEVGAGHCDMLPGPTGELVAVPRSIDYESLGDVEFGEVHAAVKSFHRSEHARRRLWPHLSDELSYDMVEQLLQEFERG